MFDFRIIEQPDGTQIIDTAIKTPMESLTPEMQLEYMEVNKQVTYSKIILRRQRREAERRQRITRKPLHKLACLCRLA